MSVVRQAHRRKNPASLILLVLALSVWTCGAQPANEPREDFWTADGDVYSVLVTNGVVYLGGDFRYVGPANGGGVALDIASGESAGIFPRVDGAVYAVVSDGLGGRFIGGSFYSVGGIACTNLAHIRADRMVDPLWRPQVLGARVLALAVSEGSVYVGGNFTNVAGVNRVGFAALDVTTGAVTPLKADASFFDGFSSRPGEVRTMEVFPEGGSVVIGGDFTQINGQVHNNIAVISTVNGIVISGDFGADGGVYAMARLGPWLYVAGAFTSIGGVPRRSLAAIDLYGGFVTFWNPQAQGVVNALAVTCNTVYAGGQFTIIGGQPRNYLAALDAFTGLVLPWNANLPVETSNVIGVSALASREETIYVGGRFTSVGGQPRTGIAAIDANTGTATKWNPSAGGAVYALNVSGNSIYVGGQSISLGGQPRNYVAALSADTGKLTDWNPDANGVVGTLAYANGTVYLGGGFTQISGQPRTSLAAVSTNGIVTDWNPGTLISTSGLFSPGQVYALAIAGNTVYVGGGFDASGGQFRSGIAALNAATGLATSWNPSAAIISGGFLYPGEVHALAISGNNIYVGGRFDGIGGQFRSGIAALNAATGLATDWNPGAVIISGGFFFPGEVHTLALSGNNVYAGGKFNATGQQFRSGIAALNAATGLATDWNPFADGVVSNITVVGSTIYTGGSFTQIGGKNRSNVAALDFSTGAARTWSPGLSSSVRAIAIASNSVFVGGNFFLVNNRHRGGFAAFPLVGSPVVLTQPQDQVVRAGSPVNLSVNATGQAPLSYQWRVNGIDLPGATSATLAFPSAGVEISGFYDVRVSNSQGQVYSDPVRVVAFVPPTLTAQPISQTVNAGSTVLFSAIASGSPAPSYQWRLNGVNIPGATEATLRLPNVQTTNGGSYSVVVANAGGALSSSVASLVVTSPSLPLADNLAERATTNSFAGVGSGSNVNATRETGEPRHAGKSGGKSMWYAWRAPASGIATFSTRGSGFDTLLAVYRGTSQNSLTNVVSDDDRGGFLTSQVSFSAVAGTEYLIAIDGLGGTSGNIVLSWNLDATFSVLPRIVTQPRNQSVSRGSNVTFTVEVSSPIPVSYQWYHNCALIFFATNSSLTLSNVYPALAGSYIVLVGNSVRTVVSEPVFLELGLEQKVVSQDKFQDLFSDAESAATLGLTLASVQPESAVRKSGFASVAAGVLGTQILNNFGATTEPGEPNHAGAAGGASRWFNLRADTSGIMVLDTIGSEIDTVLAVYTGTNLLTLKPIASDNNSAPDGVSAVVNFPAVPGIDYLVAVDGVNGAQGNIKLNWKLEASLLRLENWERLSGGTFRFRLTGGVTGSSYIVQTSTNFFSWLPIFTNTAVNGGFEFTDSAATSFPFLYYRATKKP